MKAAVRPRRRGVARLLAIDPCHEAWSDSEVRALPGLLRAGDLVVVNDAATLPASLPAQVRGEEVEIRLAGEVDGGFRAVLFGAGDWRTPTEHRPAPPAVRPGDRLEIAKDFTAIVTEVGTVSARLVSLLFDTVGQSEWAAIYVHGRPVQYSHLAAPLELWDVQTIYGGRPWAVEAPSAGLPLDGAALVALAKAGVRVVALTHAAGLSSTGDPVLDAALPFPERYDIPAATVAAIEATRARGGRVVAVGTSVVRALEGAALSGKRKGITDLRIRPGHRLRVVDGIVTGLHEVGSSHLDLLGAFVRRPLLEAAYAHAGEAGYLGHELGDASLILCS